MKKKNKMHLHKLSKNERLYNIEIPIIGITGSIATGKTTVSNILKDNNQNVICADTLVKKIYSKNETLQYVKTNFNEAYRNGAIDFKCLREIFFNNKKAELKIEKLIIPQLKQSFMEELKTIGDPPYIIYDIPLLFEKKYQHKLDVTVCVYTKPEIQIQRLIKRDKITKELALKIINKQMTIDEKKQAADIVIDNSLSYEHTSSQTHKLIELLSVWS